MKAPKVLAVASAVDLDFRYGCTPAWWQLWRALAETGVDLIVTAYRGRAVDSPWWRTIPNPLYREAELYAAGRGLAARLRRQEFVRRDEHEPADTTVDRAVREAVWRYVTPRWRRHLEHAIEREGGVDAVVVFTVPMAHFRGVPTALRDRFDVPVVYYDGDLPMSLPEFGGTDTSGFNYYVGADPGEYDLIVGNSEGGLERVRELGARRTEAVHWAADPELFRPLDVEKESDVFFYGHSDKFRREWMRDMIGEPSRLLPEADFAVGGYDYRGDVGRAGPTDGRGDAGPSLRSDGPYGGGAVPRARRGGRGSRGHGPVPRCPTGRSSLGDVRRCCRYELLSREKYRGIRRRRCDSDK